MQRNVEDRDEYTWMFQHPYKKAILPEVSNSIEVLNNLGAKNTRKTKIFAPILKQLAALTWRANICAMRDPILTVIRLVQTLFNAIIVLSIWWQISDDPLKADSVHNRTGVLYFCAMFNFIPGMFMVLISCIFFLPIKKSPNGETRFPQGVRRPVLWGGGLLYRQILCRATAVRIFPGVTSGSDLLWRRLK